MDLSSDLITTFKDGILVIKFNRPRSKNAISAEMYVNLEKILTEAAKNDAVTLTVFTGTGDFYSSGNDIMKGMAISNESVQTTIKKSVETIRKLVAAFINFPKLLIAVVNGPAIGFAATTLALFDVVYASDKAYFWTPFTKLGLCAEGCSSYTFPKILGISKASEMLYLNHKMSAKEALQRGFVSEIFPDTDMDKLVWPKIKEFSKLFHGSIRISKSLVRQTECETLLMVNDRECLSLQHRMQSDEFIEGITSYISKKNKL